MIRVLCADALDALRDLQSESIDALVTDPPAGISFMGRSWDDAKGGRDEWIGWLTAIMREVLRVLKPGAHGLVWALPRTQHWTATALENAGFEIRDTVTHLFGSGFPKSMNVAKAIDAKLGVKGGLGDPKSAAHAAWISRGRIHGKDSDSGWGRPYDSTEEGVNRTARTYLPGSDEAKAWDGWGTALKPAAETWVLVRKPLAAKTLAENVLRYGAGAINIEASRVGDDLVTTIRPTAEKAGKVFGNFAGGDPTTSVGRYPANVVLSHHPLCHPSGAFREISGDSRATEAPGARPGGFYDVGAPSGDGKPCGPLYGPDTAELWACAPGCAVADLEAQEPGASRFFYVAKPSQEEKQGALRTLSLFDSEPEARPDRNNHVTVKPVALMRYFCRLVCPAGGTIVDPFAGSGTAGVAAVMEGFSAILVEREAQSALTANARCERAARERGL